MTDQNLLQDIETIVSPATRGDPENPLLWSSKSTQNIADILNVFKNNGQEYEPKGQPTEVSTHDFPLKETENRPASECGKVAPFGIYDCTHDTGFFNVGISGDTAQFAVNSIRT